MDQAKKRQFALVKHMQMPTALVGRDPNLVRVNTRFRWSVSETMFLYEVSYAPLDPIAPEYGWSRFFGDLPDLSSIPNLQVLYLNPTKDGIPQVGGVFKRPGFHVENAAVEYALARLVREPSYRIKSVAKREPVYDITTMGPPISCDAFSHMRETLGHVKGPPGFPITHITSRPDRGMMWITFRQDGHLTIRNVIASEFKQMCEWAENLAWPLNVSKI